MKKKVIRLKTDFCQICPKCLSGWRDYYRAEFINEIICWNKENNPKDVAGSHIRNPESWCYGWECGIGELVHYLESQK